MYPVNICPDQGTGVPQNQTVFRGSACKYEDNFQDYKISCAVPTPPTPDLGPLPYPPGFDYQPRPPIDWYDGACPSEICIQQTADSDGWMIGVYPTAWCILGASYTTLAKTLLAEGVRRIRSPVPWAGPASIQILLAGQDDENIVFHASEISVTPRDANDVPLAAAVSCDNCGDLEFFNLPANVANIDANITMPNPDDIAQVAVFWFDS